jgi:UDP-2,3-diacylglucosamine hydrolase
LDATIGGRFRGVKPFGHRMPQEPRVSAERPQDLGDVYFLGDAHLGAESPPLERRKLADLCALLRYLEGRASHVYVVGDLFDFWFEYRRAVPTPHAEVIRALAALAASGTAISFLGGNHDYWAGGQLEKATGATVHRQPVRETRFGRRLFIAHGDGLPSGDWGYRALKAVIRSRLAIAGFRLIPPRIGAAVARWASGLSEVTEERVERALPPMMDFLQRVLESGYDGAVVGHIHRPVLKRLGNGTGVIVGDWMVHRSVVALGKHGFSMLRWSDGSLVEVESESHPLARDDRPRGAAGSPPDASG